jgi:LPS O-antigen subunit length determinant protein (WzzB/FepE family)
MNQDGSKLIADDEIDLKELFKTIWSGRILILFCISISICLASFYLHNAERQHSVSYFFQPVAADDGAPNLNGLSGLASLAGVSLPTAKSSDFKTFQILLQAEEVATKLMQDQKIIKQVFENEWDDVSQQFKEPSLSAKSKILGPIKSLLTGEDRRDYMAPNAARLSVWLSKAFSSSEDRDTGLLKLTSQTNKPDLILSTMTRVTTIADQIIKDRFLKSGRQSVEFYQAKIAAARSSESREALAQLIAKEEQKLMLASNGSFFVAKPLTTPTVSLYPTSPKASLVLALSLVLGGFLGTALVLIRKVVKNV